MVYSTDARSIREHRVNGPRRSKKGHKPLGPKSTLFLFFFPSSERDPKFTPRPHPGNPGRFTYRHFASGNFHCFAGLVNPYWGLPEPPPATHPGIHTGARFRTLPLIRSPLSFPPPSLLQPPTISTLAPRPADRPLFPAAPPEREKPAASRPGSGLGCFHPHQWRHRRHPIGRCRGSDVTSGSLIGRHVLSTFLLYTLSHRRRSGWHEPGWLERVRSLSNSLYFSLFLSPSLSFSPSLPLFFSPALSVSFCFALFPALSLFVWKHGASEGYLVKYPQRCSHIKNRVRQKNSLCICREETDFHYTDVNDHLASFIVNRSQQFRLFFFFFIISHLIAAHLITRRKLRLENYNLSHYFVTRYF